MSVKNSKHAQQLIGFNTDERPKGDFYPSPRIAVEKLLEHEIMGFKVWEPCCGDGAVCKVLEEYGYDFYASDLYDWGYGESGKDFLNTECPLDIDTIVTNPPFNISNQIVLKALSDMKKVGGKVVVLQRLSFLESVKRLPLFKDYPFSKCLVFSKRLPRMHRFDWEGKKAGSMLAFAWFIWDYKHEGSPIIDWI